MTLLEPDVDRIVSACTPEDLVAISFAVDLSVFINIALLPSIWNLIVLYPFVKAFLWSRSIIDASVIIIIIRLFPFFNELFDEINDFITVLVITLKPLQCIGSITTKTLSNSDSLINIGQIWEIS